MSEGMSVVRVSWSFSDRNLINPCQAVSILNPSLFVQVHSMNYVVPSGIRRNHSSSARSPKAYGSNSCEEALSRLQAEAAGVGFIARRLQQREEHTGLAVRTLGIMVLQFVVGCELVATWQLNSCKLGLA